MLLVTVVCLGLLVATTLIHYEVLRGLSIVPPMVRIQPRAKLILVIITAFLAHVVEILLYAVALYSLIHLPGLGSLQEAESFSMATSLYFSAETYTSLGYGDVVPTGAVRLLAGAEALNGLLLIGWSASYAYIAMERFWKGEEP